MPRIRCYTCGRELETALGAARVYNDRGVKTSLAHLPIRTKDPARVQQEADYYVRILRAIAENALDSDVTVKLHQFGLYRDYKLARDGVLQVVEEAKRLGNFVWIDMELKPTVSDTIRLYREMKTHTDAVGICLQAYLKRTESDMDALLPEGAVIRLVKGFYRTSDFRKWSNVTANYERLMLRLLERGAHPVVATHDLRLLDEALRIVRKRGIINVEFQFAKNIRDELAEELARQGFRVRMYVPFGDVTRFLLSGIWTFDKWRNLQRILARPVIH